MTMHDDAPALIDEDGATWTWRALRDARDARARQLPDDPFVVVTGQQTRETLLTLWACAGRAGRAIVPVIVHPRDTGARARALVDAIAPALAQLNTTERAQLGDVMFTSGTSAAKKAIAHDDDAWAFAAAASQRALPFGPGDRWLLNLPLAHVSGLGVWQRALHGGACVVLPPREARSVDVAALVQRHAITHLSVVRTTLGDLVHDPRVPALTASLRHVVVGGGPTPLPLLQRACALGLPMQQTWGMTETCAMVTLSDVGAPSSCGRALPGRHLRVMNGLLGVRDEGLARGIVTADGLRPLPRDDDGYFPTHDRASIDDDGNLVIGGRADSVFISGGEKIVPEHVEAALLEHPFVVDALVVPVPHPRWGQRPVAFVRGAPDHAWPDVAGAVREHLRTTLSTWEQPDALLPWPEDVVGKPSRIELAGRAQRAIANADPPLHVVA